MSDKIWFDPTSDRWGLSDGKHYLEVPHWAREIIVNEFERETRQLKAENAKLVDVLHEVEDEAVLAFNSLRQDCETITDSSQHFFEKWWHAECEVDRLKSDNARLREQLAKARDPQRIGGTADPESFVYAIEQLREFRWQHATNDEEAIPYINNIADAHERENAKLRELVSGLEYCVQGYVCDSCPLYDPSGANHRRCESLERELGVEVTE